MAQERTIALNVIAKLEQFERNIKKSLPNITEKAAARAALKMQTRFASEEAKRVKMMEATAQKIARSQEKAAKEAATAQLQASKRAAEQSAKFWREAVGLGLTAAAGLTTAAFVSSMLEMQSSVAAYHVELDNMSDRSGIAVETLAALDRASRASGMEFGELDSALEDISTRWIEFGINTGEAKEAFERMGFSQADVAAGTKDFDKTVRDVIGRLQGMENAADRMHNANLAMGGSGQKLIQVLGDHTLDEWIASVNMYGADVGPKAVAASVEWQAKTAALSIVFQGFKQKISEIVGTSDLIGEWGGVFVGALSATLKHMELWKDSASKFVAAFRATATGDFEAAAQGWERFSETLTTDNIEVLVDAYTEANQAFQDQIVFLRRAAEAERARATTIQTTKVEIEKQAQALIALNRIGTDVASDTITREEAILALAQKRTAELQLLQAQNLINAGQAADALSAIEARKSRDMTTLARDRQRQFDKILAEQTEDTITAEAAIKRATGQRLLEVLAMERQGAITQQQLRSSVLAINAREQRDLTALASEESWARSSAEIQAISAKMAASEAEWEAQNERFNAGVALAQDYAASVVSIYDSITAHLLANDQREIDASKNKIAKLREQRKKEHDRIKKTGTEQEKDQAKRNQLEIDGKIGAEREKLAAARKSARKMAVAQRAGALFGVGVDTLGATMKAFAMFGPPPSPAGIAAAGAAVVAGTAAGIGIAAEPLPSLFRGGGRATASTGMAGDGSYVASLHPRERVLNGRAATALGDEVVSALNEGLAPLAGMSGGGGDVYLGTEQVGRVTAAGMRRAGPMQRAAADAGRDGRRFVFGRA